MTTLPADEYDSLLAWMRAHGLGHGAGTGAVLGAYRRDLTALLQAAADGRREYAVNATEDGALVLEDEARQLETVIRLVNGDITAMTAWLPSWRWTGEMCPELEGKANA